MPNKKKVHHRTTVS